MPVADVRICVWCGEKAEKEKKSNAPSFIREYECKCGALIRVVRK